MNKPGSGTPVSYVKQENAQLKSLQSITAKEQLATLLGCDYGKHLAYYLYRLHPSMRYRTFDIQKRNGDKRTINAPNSGLVHIQRRLSRILYEIYSPRQGVNGFLPNKGIYSNAEQHKRQRFILNIDIENFFGSINFGRVRGLLISQPYGLSPEVATVIAQICCYEGFLPQGAPTSPIISNMICGRLDANLKAYAKSFGCYYTRYADDITISFNGREYPRDIARYIAIDGKRNTEIDESLREVLRRNGFELNERKSRLLSREDRQVVTGLVVNRFPNVPRKYIRNIRASLHAWRKFGPQKFQEFFSEKYLGGTKDAQRVMRGRIQYVGNIRGYSDSIYLKLRDSFNELAKEKISVTQSQKQKSLYGAVWVLEDHDSISQGSAFFLSGIGLVTCAHCVGSKPFIYHPNAPAKKYNVSVIKSSADVDLAVLKIDEEIEVSSLESQSFLTTLEVRTDVTLVGYPDHAPGKTLSIKDGKVQSFTMKSGVKRANISSPIIGGNSGGPVLSRYGRVVGVAVTGADTEKASFETEEHGVIPISALVVLGYNSPYYG
ncbi:reverse transcriptase domain-containing protein [Caulobacter sp.]|uniref:reverse transcriptase domain-containing protein n=1 Tax=Caulobacter sp. TaxID=78 RepID=UPI003BB21520